MSRDLTRARVLEAVTRCEAARAPVSLGASAVMAFRATSPTSRCTAVRSRISASRPFNLRRRAGPPSTCMPRPSAIRGWRRGCSVDGRPDDREVNREAGGVVGGRPEPRGTALHGPRGLDHGPVLGRPRDLEGEGLEGVVVQDPTQGLGLGVGPVLIGGQRQGEFLAGVEVELVADRPNGGTRDVGGDGRLGDLFGDLLPSTVTVNCAGIRVVVTPVAISGPPRYSG